MDFIVKKNNQFLCKNNKFKDDIFKAQIFTDYQSAKNNSSEDCTIHRFVQCKNIDYIEIDGLLRKEDIPKIMFIYENEAYNPNNNNNDTFTQSTCFYK